MNARPLLPGLALAATIVALSAGLKAIESASASLERERPTSGVDAVSLKPPYLFDMRGRGDPFMAYPLLTTAVPAAKAFDVEGLQFAGLIEVRGRAVALFSDSQGRSYLLRGGNLYAPDDRAVPGVRGGVIRAGDSNKVVLVQGDRKLTFTCRRPSKRLGPARRP